MLNVVLVFGTNVGVREKNCLFKSIFTVESTCNQQQQRVFSLTSQWKVTTTTTTLNTRYRFQGHGRNNAKHSRARAR